MTDRPAAARVRIDLVDPRSADDDTVRACLEVLQDEERERNGRFLFAHLRRDHAVAHAAQRVALSRGSSVPPSAWRYRRTEHGRPYVSAPADAAPFFNLSHTEGAIAVATSRDAELGVDVERRVERPNTLDIAPNYFAPSEVAALRGAPAHERLAVFFAFWSLKEAYIKARGLGLAIPLDAFAFDLTRPRPRIAFDGDRIDDDPGGWWFSGLDHAPGCALALAVRTTGPVEVEVHRTTPRALVAELETVGQPTRRPC